MQANISTIWPHQMYDPKTAIFRKVNPGSVPNGREVYIIHAGGNLVLLTQFPLDGYGITSKYTVSNSGGSGYSAHFTYDMNRKAPKLTLIGDRLKMIE